jgi:hypothetical protein
LVIDESGLKNHLSTIQSLDGKTLSNVLYSFPSPLSKNGLSCQFFLIECTSDEIREHDFIKFIISRIIVYVLKRKDYLLERLTPEERASRMTDIVKKAKSKFVQNSQSGESGEIILFLILESKGIIQLLNKMNLKTSGQMHYNGLDAIHIQVHNGIILHYGQSKLHSNFSQGVRRAINDINKFDLDKEEHEINLVSSYIDDSRFDKYTESIIDIISPYPKKRNLIKTNAVFIGYDWDLLNNHKKQNQESLCDYLQKEYEIKHHTLYKKIQTLTKKKLSTTRSTTFYILPFKNIAKFRSEFLEELNK